MGRQGGVGGRRPLRRLSQTTDSPLAPRASQVRGVLLVGSDRLLAYNRLMSARDQSDPESLPEFKFFGWKCCATCENWRGKRVAVENEDKVRYRSADMTGQCQGGWSGHDRRPSDACSQWLRWTALK